MDNKKPYHHGNLRATLLSASLELIRDEGAHALTLREVARRAGVSHNAPYRHFRDKDDLLAAVAEEGFSTLAAQMRAAIAPSDSPSDRLRRAGLAYIEFGLTHPEEFHVMFTIRLDLNAHPSAKLAANSSFDLLLNLAEACQRSRPISCADPRTAAKIAWAHVHGIVELARRNQLELSSREDIDQFALFATSALLHGLLNQSE